MKIISIVWDEDEDTLALNHEGCNRFEAVGMLVQALDLANAWVDIEEVEDGSTAD